MKVRSTDHMSKSLDLFLNVSPPQEMEGDPSKPKRTLESEKSTRFGDSGEGKARFQSPVP